MSAVLNDVERYLAFSALVCAMALWASLKWSVVKPVGLIARLAYLGVSVCGAGLLAMWLGRLLSGLIG